jgi:hypothetical protein
MNNARDLSRRLYRHGNWELYIIHLVSNTNIFLRLPQSRSLHIVMANIHKAEDSDLIHMTRNDEPINDTFYSDR